MFLRVIRPRWYVLPAQRAQPILRPEPPEFELRIGRPLFFWLCNFNMQPTARRLHNSMLLTLQKKWHGSNFTEEINTDLSLYSSWDITMNKETHQLSSGYCRIPQDESCKIGNIVSVCVHIQFTCQITVLIQVSDALYNFNGLLCILYTMNGGGRENQYLTIHLRMFYIFKSTFIFPVTSK